MIEVAVWLVFVALVLYYRHQIHRAATVSACWFTGHRGLGSICHNCGVRYTRRGL